MSPEPDAGVDSVGWLYLDTYYASDASALDSEIITFDTATEQFSVYTDQQSKAGVYMIKY